MTTTYDKLAQLRRETPGADGFDPADEDLAVTFDPWADAEERDRLREVNAELLAALESIALDLNSGELKYALATASAAIAKAKGGQP